MVIDRATLARARLALKKAVANWMYDPNIMLIDFGWPEHNQELARDELAIRCHVIEKHPVGPALETAIVEGRTLVALPDTFEGFPVDVPIGKYRLNQMFWGGWQPAVDPRARRADPMQGGISISNANWYTYATLGSLVVDRASGAPMILSNWHVLAGDWRARAGRAIYQPGRMDGGSSLDTVAKLTRHAMSSGLDAAVAELTGNRQLINNQYEIKPVSGVGSAVLGMEVIKSGRRTEVTRGVITAILGTLRMTYGGVERLIQDVVTIEPRIDRKEVSAGGDSGSLWCEESSMQAIALHFAGGNEPERALAMDIQSVLDALNVDLVI